MKTQHFIFMVLALCMLGGCGHSDAQVQGEPTWSAPMVTLPQGALRGVASKGVQAFLGIPYAAPPTGERRWRPPSPALAWEGVRPAAAFGASCLQADSIGHGPWTMEYLVQNEVNEDCLFLNVWAPRESRDATLPVLVWIPGGGYVEGSASVPIYDGAALARDGIIVVSVNYRLNAFGFLAHPELSAEGNGHSGNYGLMDMVAALQWVRENIHAFGGDPARVTLAGQSMGALSVYHLMTLPESKGLFAQAIAQSGLGIGYMGMPVFSLADAESQGLDFAEKAGVASLAELRALPAQTLLNIKTSIPESPLPFLPVADTPPSPAAYADIPLLTGVNADEGSGLTPGYGEDTLDEFNARLQAYFTERAGIARQFWPAYDDAEARAFSKQLVRERGMASMWLWARERANSGGRQPVWMYLFAHVEPGYESERYGAFHSSEMPYVFQTLDAAPERPFTQTDEQLSQIVTRYWSNFIKSGNPNGAGLPQWPVLEANAETPKLLWIESNPAAQPVLSAEKRAFFSGYFDQGGKIGMF